MTGESKPPQPPEHLALWNRGGYELRIIARHMFSDGELRLLEHRGHWLEALEVGAILPVTEAQERFVKVCREELPPEGTYERVWMKLKYRREFERHPRLEVDIYEPGERWNPRHENWRYNQYRYP